MGAGNDPTQNKRYFNVMKGNFTEKVKSDTPGAESRINKNEEEVWELKFNFLSGYIVNIETRSHEEYGKFWRLTLQDGDEYYVFDVGYRSGSAMGILYRLQSIDFAKPVKFKSYWLPKDGDKEAMQARMVIYQDGEKLDSNYTKENDYNGMPPMEEKEVNGETIWDSTKKMEFLENMVMMEIFPKLSGIAAPEIKEEEVAAESITEPEETTSEPGAVEKAAQENALKTEQHGPGNEDNKDTLVPDEGDDDLPF